MDISNLYILYKYTNIYFSSNKPTEAFVFQFTDSLDEKIKIKEIIDILDENPIFRKEDLELVYWMKNRYLCTYIECINLIYPK
ncbi:hypothetical protein BGU91_11855, partial [Clostridioides difficile]|uniref:primosomal protein N' family DNA-binding protein n=1 Tax=Clostridioides difficile TaxID=1496 RepID=UPI000BCCED96